MESQKVGNLYSWIKRRLRIQRIYSKKERKETADGKLQVKENITNPTARPSSEKKLKNSKPVESVNGNFCLENVRGSVFPGHQSTATSLCAILRAQAIAPHSWTCDVIDKVLLQGDRLHTVRTAKLKKMNVASQQELTPEELPKRYTFRRTEYYAEVSKVQSIRSLSARREKRVKLAIAAKLKKILTSARTPQHAGALLTLGKHTLALLWEQDFVYCFQTCHHSPNTLLPCECKAVLNKFRDCEHLAIYLSEKLVELDDYATLYTVDLQVDCHTWADSSFNVHLPIV